MFDMKSKKYRFTNAYKMNKYDREYHILILNEKYIEEERSDNIGAGYEILILPSKYRNTKNPYLKNVIRMALIRNGELIFV